MYVYIHTYTHTHIYIYKSVYPKIAQAIRKMSVNEIRDFIFENYYKRTRFCK